MGRDETMTDISSHGNNFLCASNSIKGGAKNYLAGGVREVLRHLYVHFILDQEKA